MDLLERYERQAVLLDRPEPDMPWDAFGDMVGDPRAPAAVRKNLSRARALGALGPRAGFGPFWQMLDGAICLADQTAVTGTTEVALWPTAQYTAWSGNQLRAGQIWYCLAGGVMSTAGASQGNITITPRFGTSSSGTALGASVATALVASASNVAWNLWYILQIRQVGAAGANSNVIGFGEFHTTVAAIAASTGNVVPFSSTANVAVDLSVNQGLYMGVTLGSASDSMKTLMVGLTSMN